MSTEIEVIGVCEPDIGYRVIWVQIESLLVMLNGFLIRLFRPLLCVVAANQVILISIEILGVAFSNLLPLGAAQSQSQRVRYLPGDFFLRGKEVGEFTVVPLTPYLGAV